MMKRYQRVLTLSGTTLTNRGLTSGLPGIGKDEWEGWGGGQIMDTDRTKSRTPSQFWEEEERGGVGRKKYTQRYMSEVGTEMDEDDEEEGGFLSSYSSLLLPSAGDEALLLGCRNSEAEGLVAAPPRDPNAPKSSSSSSSRSSGVGKLRMPRPQGFDLWFCSIVDVPCTQSAEWNIFLSFVTDDERMKITRFRFDDDRKRALVSILLQKAFIRHRLGLGLYADADGSSSSGSGAYDGDEDVFSIRRTPEGKPYAFLKGQPGAPTLDGHWNYNLSHHGQFVAIVSHPKYLIGIDLVDISTRSPSIRSAQAYVEMFDRNLEQKELAFILG